MNKIETGLSIGLNIIGTGVLEGISNTVIRSLFLGLLNDDHIDKGLQEGLYISYLAFKNTN